MLERLTVLRRPAVLAALLALVSAPLVVAAEPAAAHHGGGHRVGNCLDFALKGSNNRYVSAESGGPYRGSWDGMLRARATRIGPWERFSICSVLDDPVAPSTVAMFAVSKRGWVSAEIGDSVYPGMLRGRPDSIKVETWEEYRFITPFDGCGCVAIISMANDQLVSAEQGYALDDTRYGMLRARNGYVGPWETFTLIPLA